MEELITIEVKIYPRLKSINSNVIDISMNEGSDIETVMKQLCLLVGEEFQDRFYQEGKCKSLIFLNGKVANLKTTIKENDVVTLAPIVGGG